MKSMITRLSRKNQDAQDWLQQMRKSYGERCSLKRLLVVQPASLKSWFLIDPNRWDVRTGDQQQGILELYTWQYKQGRRSYNEKVDYGFGTLYSFNQQVAQLTVHTPLYHQDNDEESLYEFKKILVGSDKARNNLTVTLGLKLDDTLKHPLVLKPWTVELDAFAKKNRQFLFPLTFKSENCIYPPPLVSPDSDRWFCDLDSVALVLIETL